MSIRDYYAEKVRLADQGEPLYALFRAEYEMHSRNLKTAFDHFDNDGLGATFGNGHQFGMVLPDPEGGYRYQIFDAHGFVSHGRRDSADACVFSLVHDYRLYRPAPRDTLDKLSATPEWKRGSFRLDLVRQVNEGLISMEEANRRAIQYDLAQAC